MKWNLSNVVSLYNTVTTCDLPLSIASIQTQQLHGHVKQVWHQEMVGLQAYVSG